MRLLVAAAIVAALSSACALTSKSDSVIFRYFTPEKREPPADASRAPVATPFELRLGRVGSAAYLRDRIAFRDAGFEVGYYDDLRWTEQPEAYLRRALSRELFDRAGMQQVVSGPAPTLEVDLDAFEEVRASTRVARVEITWVLRGEHTARQETFAVERPIAGVSDPGAAGAPAALAAALGDALHASVSRVALRVSDLLAKERAATGTSPVQ